MQIFEVNKIILSFYSIEVGGVKSEVESYAQNSIIFKESIILDKGEGDFFKVLVYLIVRLSV